MWTILASFSTVGEAESARSALEAAGIETRVDDENTIALQWLYSNALGGVKLLVREEQYEAAAELLSLPAEQADSAAPVDAGDDELAPPDEAPRCLSCGGGEFERVPRLGMFGAIGVVVLGVGVAIEQHVLTFAALIVAAIVVSAMRSHRCTSCGTRVDLRDEPAEPAPVAPAPEPEPADRIEPRCPRCGSAEFYYVPYRRLRTASLFTVSALAVVLPVWLFLPKWKCDSCGLRRWVR